MIAVLAVAGVVFMVGALAVTNREAGEKPGGGRAEGGGTALGRTDRPGVSGPVVGARQPAVAAAIARLEAMPAVEPSTSPEHPPLGDQARGHPDLYARAFTGHLLAQDYRTSRGALLAWVQSESALCTEPTVVGLTPPALRPRLAVASIQDATGGPPPVPAPEVWAALGELDGYTTVDIQRVFIPPTWSAAVAAGTITDPGVTARQVDAQLTVHTREHGEPQTTTYSVAVTMNLQGPPAREAYGFVTAVTYDVVGDDR